MSRIFEAPPEPKSELGRYRVLSTNAGVRVSPLALGAMSIGEAWKDFMGSMDKEQSFKLLDHFYEQGGNFIDTANNYQDEESEQWIGEWMEKSENRDSIFIATKFTTNYVRAKNPLGRDRINYTGNHKKSLMLSVRDSLKKLKTGYIDLLYLHWWDWTTSIPEVMDSLHHLVQNGQVLYLGISDTPAWIVSAANTYAIAHGKTPFSVYQGRWNVLLRDFERDIIPMARQFGMALCPWDVIGGGRFKTKAQIEERKKESGSGVRALVAGPELSEDEAKVSAALEDVAKEHNASLSAIAIAYVMQKARYVFPLVGGRKTEHLDDNIKALSIHLSDKQIEHLESIKPFDIGFPMTMVQEDAKETGIPSGLLSSGGQIAFQPNAKPIGHQ